MTHLRKIMLEELERRIYSVGTKRRYLRFVERFAQHFGMSPDKLGPDHLRSYQAYLLREQNLSPGTVENHVAALRFFYLPRKLPKILSQEEVTHLINASSSLFQRTLLMVLAVPACAAPNLPGCPSPKLEVRTKQEIPAKVQTNTICIIRRSQRNCCM